MILFTEKPLREFRDYLEAHFRTKPLLASYLWWFKALPEDQMEAKLSSFFHHKSEPLKQIASWSNEVETIQLISRFLAGDPDAAAELIAHEQWICGRIAWRVDDQSEQEDVQQDAWVRIFPLLDLDRQWSRHVGPVCEHLEGTGFAVEVVTVPYEFQRRWIDFPGQRGRVQLREPAVALR